jgi:hypothetical protein
VSARPTGANPKATVPAVGGLFFPQAKSLGLDQTDTSPAVQQQIVYAGLVSRSFAQASTTLQHLAGLSIDVKQVERLTERHGADRVRERDAATAAFVALPLTEKFQAPPKVSLPEVAVVMADGGRLQILERATKPAAAEPAAAEPAVAEPAAWEAEVRSPKGHWREDKVGLLLTMTSVVAPCDPCPQIPASFLDIVRIPKLAQELKAQARSPSGPETTAEPAAPPAPPAEAVYEPPRVGTRQVVASRACWPVFAPLLAAAAWALGFQGAPRKAFVGDGSVNNWVLHKRFFGSFVAILDFVHALSYVYAAAMAGRPFAEGWTIYQTWIGQVWQGQVAAVLTALAARQAELGEPTAADGETSPSRVVSQTRTYLGHHQDKMAYATYRQQGLPITSSLMESAVKQINQRVKGSEKFWSEAGSEAVLQLKADQLSDGDRLEAFWQRRQAQATGQRPYGRTG